MNNDRAAAILAKKRATVKRAEKDVTTDALILCRVSTDHRDGDPAGDSAIGWKDVAAAMGAVSLKNTPLDSKHGGGICIVVGASVLHAYGGGARERVEVPRARAIAMSKILASFQNALAKAHAQGFSEGRSLIAGLADGSTSIDAYNEAAAENAAALQCAAEINR